MPSSDCFDNPAAHCGHNPFMTVPDFQTLMRPIPAYLADGQQKSTRSVTNAMSDELGLTAEERV